MWEFFLGELLMDSEIRRLPVGWLVVGLSNIIYLRFYTVNPNVGCFVSSEPSTVCKGLYYPSL